MQSIHGQRSVDSATTYMWTPGGGSVDLSKTALLIREVSFIYINNF